MAGVPGGSQSPRSGRSRLSPQSPPASSLQASGASCVVVVVVQGVLQTEHYPCVLTPDSASMGGHQNYNIVYSVTAVNEI